MGVVPVVALNRAAIFFTEKSGDRANEGCKVGARKDCCVPLSLSGGKQLCRQGSYSGNKEILIRIVRKNSLLNAGLGFVTLEGSLFRACHALFLSLLHLTPQTFPIPFPSLTVKRRSRRNLLSAYSIQGMLLSSGESL